MSSAVDPQVIINKFVNVTYPVFVLLVANTAFSASLFTLFIVLLALSTKESRRRVVFRLNVFAICLVLTMSVLVGYCNGKAVLGKSYWVPESLPTAGIALTVFPPLLCDSILLTRLFALYPPSSTRPATLLKIYTFPFCIKCARVVVLTLYVRSAVVDGYIPFIRDPNLIAEWAMQITDNTYSVSLFLYNLHLRTGLIKHAIGISARIRQIFYISAANFVFPLIFNIVLIVFFTTIATDGQHLVLGELLVLINSYVTVFGVLCATVWFSISERVRIRNQPLPRDMSLLKPTLGRAFDDGGQYRNEIIVIGRSTTPDTVNLDSQLVTDSKRPATLTEEDKCCQV
ncbi:hypothetical protein EDD16DRAFT_811100 [Pisolithus croceorrhizus]|nr:hypothetical protein EDD16DRAFT_811100 [Pisolithus croceorrhizus]KAI6152776.1 hypothetical protein EDD17DRAFT_1126486 [Pisolithus thermaeus]